MPGTDPITAGLNFADKILSAVLPDKAQQQAARAALYDKMLDGTIAEAAGELGLAQSVNTTMQAESHSAHWLQWAWRPILGLVLGVLIVNNFVLLPYAQGFGIKPIDIPDKVWEVLLAVNGVSALTRGGEKIAAVVSQYTGQKSAQ